MGEEHDPDAAVASGPGLAQTGHETRTQQPSTIGKVGHEAAQAEDPAKHAKEPAAAEASAEVPADAYVVSLPMFEGPLDLLLSIIQKHELDILDIPVSFVTEKYLDYLDVMRTLTIDVASEYLVMAATLAHIKSKMLLPEVPKDQESDASEEEEEDPRAELVRRLLEYQKYKNAAEMLGSRDTLGSAVFPRGASEPVPEGPAPFAPFGTFDLLDAFAKLLSRSKTKIDHEVIFDRISISDRISELVDIIRPRRSMPFEELFPEQTSRFDLVITFLAVLEMARLKMMRIFQTESLAPIHVELLVIDEGADPLAFSTQQRTESAATEEAAAGDAPGEAEPEVEAEPDAAPDADAAAPDAPAPDAAPDAAAPDAAAPDDAPAADAQPPTDGDESR